MSTISLYEWMEDFDNQDLIEDERRARLQQAALVYNKENDTSYSAQTAYSNYLSWLRDKNKPDQ